MPITRLDDPNIGCLAVPISALAGLVLFALVAAALGGDAATASIVGGIGAVLGVALSAMVLRRQTSA